MYSRAGQVLVQPLSPTKPADVYFEYGMSNHTSQAEPSQKKTKTTAHIIVQNFADSVVSRFLVIPVYSMATPYCDEACAAYSRCVQLSSYAKPEITSLVPHAALHHLPCVVPVTKLRGWEPGNKTTHPVLTVNQNAAC